NSAGDTGGGVGGDQRLQASHSGQQAVAQQTAHVPSLGLFHHLAVQLSSTGPIVNANLRFQLLRRRAVIAVRPCAPPRLLLFRCPSTAPCRCRDQSMFANSGPALALDRRTLLRLAQPLAPIE